MYACAYVCRLCSFVYIVVFVMDVCVCLFQCFSECILCICGWMFMFVFVCVFLFCVCMFVHACVCFSVCICVCVYVCVYIFAWESYCTKHGMLPLLILFYMDVNIRFCVYFVYASDCVSVSVSISEFGLEYVFLSVCLICSLHCALI